MCLVAPFWMIPTPAKANVPPIQKIQIVVAEKTGVDSPGVLPIHPEVIQSADDKSIQEISKVDEIRPKERTKSNRTAGQSNTNIQRNLQKAEAQPTGRSYSKEEVVNLINAYSKLYGISPETPLCIARLESGYNQYSKNKSSSASGVFQYLSNTFAATDEGKMGQSVFNADANVKAAVKYMAIHKNTRPWVTAPQCPRLMFLFPNS